MSDFEVRGAEDFLRLSKALKAAGRTELRKELNKAMKKAGKPLVKVARDAFRADLPSRGGAGAFMAGKKTEVVTRTGRDPGVSVRVNKQDPRLDSEGRLAHPVFNQRRADGKRVYAVQQVKPRIFSDAIRTEAPAIRDDLEQALEDVAARIVREVG